MKFRINAVDGAQRVVALELQATSEAGAADSVRGQGYTVLSVRPLAFGLPARARPSAAFPLALFSIELAALLEAGLNLVEALQALGEKEANSERHEVLSGILAAIRRGESFSQAVAHFPQHFPPLYVATLKAAERTGNVREALSRYIAYQEELDRVRKKVVSALIYPAILSVVGTLVLAFLMFYVVPRFARVYEGTSGHLPFFSDLLLTMGRGIQAHGWLIAGIATAGIAALAYAFMQPSFRMELSGRLWQLPTVGARMKVYQLARLYRTVGMLLRAGIPVAAALDMVGGLLASHLQQDLARARELIQQGWSMSAAFGATGLATPVAARMMTVAERSGDMGEMMERISRFHDEETSRFIDWFTRAFEPILMAVLGVAIGAVVVLMYMPIFELAGSIQ